MTIIPPWMYPAFKHEAHLKTLMKLPKFESVPVLLINIISLILLTFACFTPQYSADVKDDDYWPTDGWRTTTPEKQGMNPDMLNKMLIAIDDQHLNIDGLVTIRNGYIVLENYYPLYEQNTLHEIYSVTKSVISALVGIAIDEGFINSVEDPVADYIPDRSIKNNSPQKQSLTIEHLLTMSSGLEWDFDEMVSNPDWVKYTLDQPMYNEPGKEFSYNSGNAQVLSAILQDVSGKDTRDFAQHYLFDPLGIDHYRWQRDIQGIPKGGWGMAMTPRDLAKLGYLYLKEGEWDGQQVVSKEWVAASTQGYVQVQEPLEPWDLSMGYMWWIHEDGLYAAQGMKGQFVYVIPDLDIVVVITSDIPDSEYHKPQLLIRDYIIPAVVTE